MSAYNRRQIIYTTLLYRATAKRGREVVCINWGLSVVYIKVLANAGKDKKRGATSGSRVF